MRAVRAARRDVHRLLVAEDLNLAALAQAQDTLSRRLTEARDLMQAHLRAVAAILPPAERQAYFDAAMRGRHGRHGGNGGIGEGAGRGRPD